MSPKSYRDRTMYEYEYSSFQLTDFHVENNYSSGGFFNQEALDR
jgi:hypothetical protein